MLRITRVAESPSHVTLRLEGKIVSDWGSVVERECLTWLQETRQVILEVAEVTFIDRSGLEMLRLRTQSRRPEELLDIIEPAFTADGQHAREVSAWALPPEDTLLRREALVHLERAIARLPDLYRAVYVLAEIEGLPHQEIATILGITVSTTKTRLHRARLLLREALANYFEGKIP